jgi:hypothetical protein
MPSKMDMNEKVLYMGLKPTGSKAEVYSNERREAKRASTSNASNGVRITDKENQATKTAKVQEALMEEARAQAKSKKAKGKNGNGNGEMCSGMYDYCEIEAITPTHVAYSQGPDMYGRTYMYDVGTGEVELGPRMVVHQELVFGKSA